ncbi:unnamed protein product, partial [Ascophyllum nodosum]
YAGYELLLGEDEDEAGEQDGEAEQEGPEQPGAALETIEATITTANSGGWAGQEKGQEEVASLVLRAMEEEYRACIESEERISSNSLAARLDVLPAQTVERPQDQPPENGTLKRVPGEFQAHEKNRSTSAELPRRPISPLGSDRAERVMRAMQGLTLSAPALPPPRFEVDWESSSTLATFSPEGNDGNDDTGSEEKAEQK